LGMMGSHTTAFSEALALRPGSFVQLDESKVAGNQMVNHMELCVDCSNKKQEERP
jgi:hypothetical protein